MTIRLIENKRYSFKFKLVWIDLLATNEQIKKKFESAGFKDVSIIGNLKTRVARATWNKKNTWMEMPYQIFKVQEF